MRSRLLVSSVLIATLFGGCGGSSPSPTTAQPGPAACPFGSRVADGGRCVRERLGPARGQRAGHDLRFVREPLVQYWLVRGTPVFRLVTRLRGAGGALELTIENAAAAGVGTSGYDQRSAEGGCFAARIEPKTGVAPQLDRPHPGRPVAVTVTRVGRRSATATATARLRPALPSEDIDRAGAAEYDALGCRTTPRHRPSFAGRPRVFFTRAGGDAGYLVLFKTVRPLPRSAEGVEHIAYLDGAGPETRVATVLGTTRCYTADFRPQDERNLTGRDGERVEVELRRNLRSPLLDAATVRARRRSRARSDFDGIRPILRRMGCFDRGVPE